MEWTRYSRLQRFQTTRRLEVCSCVTIPLSIFACACLYTRQGTLYRKFMVIEKGTIFWEEKNAVNLIPQRKKRSPYSICTQCHMWHDRETPESKRSYRGLAGFAT